MTDTPTTPRGRKKVRGVVPLLTIDEVAVLLNVSKDLVYKLMRDGELDWRTIGSKRRIREDDLARFIERGINAPTSWGGARIDKGVSPRDAAKANGKKKEES